MRPAGVAVLLTLASAGAANPGAADPVEADFRSACLDGERNELRRGDTWAWIEELCARAAAERAAVFRAADREGRLALLAEDCTFWYAANGWRLPERLRHDARARRAHVEAACRSEAEERLRRLVAP